MLRDPTSLPNGIKHHLLDQPLWRNKVNEIIHMEDLIATLYNKEDSFKTTWAPWIYNICIPYNKKEQHSDR